LFVVTISIRSDHNHQIQVGDDKDKLPAKAAGEVSLVAFGFGDLPHVTVLHGFEINLSFSAALDTHLRREYNEMSCPILIRNLGGQSFFA
jgi:hypothetical protein